ncbi:MAG: hypothetical protein MUE51_08970 [Thermoleophilia bacterium]|nr:hypothetical protein [Thermoleophilia bacterium]
MATTRAAPGGRDARTQAYRLRLAPSRVYACRMCRGAVRVTGTRYLPDSCPACGASTWEEDLRCANWIHCDAVRRPGVRGRAFCHACGHSVWTPVSSRTREAGAGG